MPYIVHRTSYIVHRTSYIVHRTSYIVHRTSYIVHRTSYIVHRTSYIVHRTSYIVHRTSYIVHRTSYIVHRTSYIVHRTSYIVHRTSYIVHRTSYIVHHLGVFWSDPLGMHEGASIPRIAGQDFISGRFLPPSSDFPANPRCPQMAGGKIGCQVRRNWVLAADIHYLHFLWTVLCRSVPSSKVT